MNNYLIPANSKKSLLIFGLFTTIDLIIFGVGVGLSLILLPTLDLSNTINVVIALFPGLTASMLVFPIPNYHNVMTFLTSMWFFYTERQNFIWRGWCFINDKEK